MKILVYLLIIASIAFADDCYMSKVAARKAQDNTETLMAKVELLRNEVSALQGQVNSLMRQNQQMMLLVKEMSDKLDNPPTYVKAKNSFKTYVPETSTKKSNVIIHNTTPKNLKAIPNKPLSEAPKIEESDDLEKWRLCAKSHSITPCLQQCFENHRNGISGLISQEHIENCDSQCKAYQKTMCGEKPRNKNYCELQRLSCLSK